MPTRGIKTFLTLLVLCVISAGAVYLIARAVRPSVEATYPVRGPVVQAFYSTGAISPVREYPVRAQVTGIITDMPVDKGDRVEKGQLLAVVTDPMRVQAVATARALLDEALALAHTQTSPALREFDTQLTSNAELLMLARRELDRLVRMRDINAASESDIDRATNRVAELTSQRGALESRRATTLLSLQRQAEVARANFTAAEAEAGKQRVLSPIDGVVLDRPTPYGTHVDAVMSNHLMTVADVRQEVLVMRAQVDEEDIAFVNPGQIVKMTLYAFGSDILTGRVGKIYDQADPERRTFEVDVNLDPTHHRLNPGMTGELAFIIREKTDALVLPAQAVQIRIRPRRPGEPQPPTPQASSAADQANLNADEVRELVVWVVRDGRMRPVSVITGLRSLERVEITDGLTTGDLAVVSPVNPRTRVESRVRPVLASPPAPDRNASTQQAQAN